MALQLDGVGELKSTPCVPAADPREFRQALPGGLFRSWEVGEITRRELWQRLERLWGPDEVGELLERARTA